MRAAWLIAALAILVSSCSLGEAEIDRDRKLLIVVDRLVSGQDAVAEGAHRTLVQVGPTAIPIIETGLYGAEPDGRRRIVRTLVAIGDGTATPILEHLAAHDPAQEVREAATRGLAKLAKPR